MPDTPVVNLDNLDDGSYIRYLTAGDDNAGDSYDLHRRDVRALCNVHPGSTLLEVGDDQTARFAGDTA